MSSLAWHSHVEVSFRSALRLHDFFFKARPRYQIWPHALRHWRLRIQLIELFFRELEDVKLIGKLELFLLQNSWHFQGVRHFPLVLPWVTAAEKLGMALRVHHISWSLAPVEAQSQLVVNTICMIGNWFWMHKNTTVYCIISLKQQHL